MRILVEKLTKENLMQKACAFTQGKYESKIQLDQIYQCEHSPIRTQMFWIEMYDIPTFVSTHFVRHKVGVEHFVKSNRGKENIDRNTLVNHAMLINAQALINIARKRLCKKASKETQLIMQEIKYQIALCDIDLAHFMVKDCEYRGKCVEVTPCTIKKENVLQRLHDERKTPKFCDRCIKENNCTNLYTPSLACFVRK